jgi:hypothetical protein
MLFRKPFYQGAKAAALLLLGLFISSCTVVENPGPLPPTRPHQPSHQFCTREYAPVCGERHNRRQTFSNSCEARRAGFDIIRRGQCSGGPGFPGTERPGRAPHRPDRPDRPHRPDRPQMCPQIYKPVCAVRDGRSRTFPNSCQAESAGYRVRSNRAC